MSQVVKFKKPPNKLKNFGFNEFFFLLVDQTPSFKTANGLHRGPRALEAVKKKEVGKTIVMELEDHRDVKATMMSDQFQFPSLPFTNTQTNESGVIPASAFMDYMIAIRDAQVVNDTDEGPSVDDRKAARKERKAKRKAKQ